MSSGKLPALVSKDDDDPSGARRDSAASSPPQASRSAQVAGRQGPPPFVPPPPAGQERVPVPQRTSFGRVPPTEQHASTPPRQRMHSSRHNLGSTPTAEAGSGIAELPANVTAPNLTHYVHHVHHYTFNAPCTIYQIAGEGNPEIYTEPGTYTYTHTERQGWPPTPGGGLRAQPPGERYYSAPAPPIFPSGTRTEHKAHTLGDAPRNTTTPRSLALEGQGTFLPSHRQPSARTPAGGGAGPEARSFTLAPFPYMSPRDNSPRAEYSGGVGYRRRHDPSTAFPSGAEEPPSKRPYRTMSAPHGSLLASRPGQHQYAPGGSSVDVHSEVRMDPMQGRTRARAGPVQEGVMTAKSSSPSDEAVQQSSPYFSVGASASGAQYSTLQSSSTNTFGTVGDQENNNDWEYIVNMYLTGQGTADGIPLRDKPKGPGSNRQDGDRKMLEKRRTIGKTYEKLGKELFELAIGYRKDEATGARRKQRMYHVIARCRVVNQMRKSLQEIPADGEELSRIIDERIAEKQQIKRGEEALGHTTLPGFRMPQLAGPSGTHTPQHLRSDFREHPSGVLFWDQHQQNPAQSQPHAQYHPHQQQQHHQQPTPDLRQPLSFQNPQYSRLPQQPLPQPSLQEQQQQQQQQQKPQSSEQLHQQRSQQEKPPFSRQPFRMPSPHPSEHRSKQADAARTPPPG